MSGFTTIARSIREYAIHGGSGVAHETVDADRYVQDTDLKLLSAVMAFRWQSGAVLVVTSQRKTDRPPAVVDG